MTDAACGNTYYQYDPFSMEFAPWHTYVSAPGAQFSCLDQWDFTGRPRNERFWLLIEHGDTEICKTYPGFDEDLYITSEAEAFVKWHAGQLAWAEATRDRRIQLHGPSWLVRAFPTWNARSAFAHIKPVRLVQATA